MLLSKYCADVLCGCVKCIVIGVMTKQWIEWTQENNKNGIENFYHVIYFHKKVYLYNHGMHCNTI